MFMDLLRLALEEPQDLIPGSKEMFCRLTERVVYNSVEKKKQDDPQQSCKKKSCKGTSAKFPGKRSNKRSNKRSKAHTTYSDVVGLKN